MINVFALFAAVFVVFSVLPPEVWSSIRSNCCDSKGRIRLSYLARETRAISSLFADLLIFSLVIVAIGTVPLYAINRVIPLPLAVDAASHASLDAQQWKRELTRKPRSIRRQFETYHLKEGGTKESALRTMKTLWAVAPAAIAICFICLVLTLKVFSTAFNSAVQRFANKTFECETRRIRRRYLRDSASHSSFEVRL
ncbi:hypothetical protein LOC67_24300 [Stieleria sp. JC731]|nr:hypothetical protein [Stieleria sp. JC731]MCC9603683.1 hypothetical protein [Stieleria sp. JC731]